MRWSCCLLAVICLGALGAGPATQPASRPADRKAAFEREILRQILQLDAADAAVRDAAAARLLAIGPPAIEPLKEMITRHVSPELETRARALLDEIPRSWKYVSEEGGAVVAGFQATLRSRRTSAAPGEPLSLSVQIQNVGGARRRMASLRALDVEVGGKLAASTWSDARLVIRPVGQAKPLSDPQPLVISRSQPQMMDMEIGACLGDNVDLAQLVKLGPGQYDIQIVYYTLSHDIVPDAVDDVTTNTIRITITSP